MKVALFSSEFPPFNNVGGIATFMAELAKLLIKAGHRVIVFTDGGQSLTHQTTINGVIVVPFLNRKNSAFIRALISWLPTRFIITILREYVPDIAKLLRYNLLALLTFISYREHASLRVIHTPVLFAPAYLISLMFPTLTIITHAQGPDELLQPYNTVSWDARLKVRIEASYMKRSRIIIPCNQTINRYLQEKYRAIRKKIRYIPNFINTKVFPKRQRPLDTNTLLFIGRMEYRKGPDLVVKAFAKLIKHYPNLRLILLGEDPYSWFINGKPVLFSDYVRSLRLPPLVKRQMAFIPRLDDRQKLLRYLSRHCGIAILPSRYEPFGFVFIETMLTGYVTIASTHGGGAEIIQNGVNGFLVEPTVNDIVTCVQKIKRLPAQQLTRLTSRAKKHIISTYDISRVEDSYQKLYRFFSTRH